jgi:putative copper export protein
LPTRCPLCQGIVAVRLGLYVAISAVFGISLFALDGLPAAELRALPLRAIVGVDSGVGLGLSALGMCALAAGMSATPLTALKADDLRAMGAVRQTLRVSASDAGGAKPYSRSGYA